MDQGPFNDMVLFGVKFPKKSVKFPKEWQKLTKSVYNGEKNYAILTGKINDIVVIDLDIKGETKEERTKSIKWFEENISKIKECRTLVTKSVNGGYHIFYKYNSDLKSTSLKDYNIDILSDRKCCFGGEGYEILMNNPIQKLTTSQLENIKKNLKKTEIIDTATDENITEKDVLEILNGLSDKRCDNRDDWLRVGYVLSKYPFGERLFLNFSKRSKLFNKDRHKVDWDSLQNNENNDKSVTIGTLIYWLKDDDYKLYTELSKKKKILNELDHIVNNSDRANVFNITHTELIKHSKTSIEALINHNLTITDFHNIQSPKCRRIQLYTHCTITGIKFKCSNCNFEYPPEIIPIDKHLAPNIFNTLIINEDINNKDTSQIADKIREKVNLIFFNKEWYKYDELTGLYKNQYKEQIINIIDNLEELLHDESISNPDWFSWVKKISYKKTLLEELEAKCFEVARFDQDPYLFGFQNGVYDLRNGTFRKALQNEYVNMTCAYDYTEDFNSDLAYKFLSDIFPIKEELDYAINRFSLMIEGINREQTMTFNYGFTASNGKSYLMERIKNAMGDYGDSFSVNLLTNKMKGAGESNSTLINFKNKRFLYCSEPEAGAKLNTNFIKILTGDEIKARGLYASKEEIIKATYNIYACCNVLPSFDTYDEGISRRIRLLDYKTRFCEEPKKKNEKRIKKYTMEEEAEIELGLLHIFIENYNKLKSNGFIYKEPDYISSMRRLYVNDNKDEIMNLLMENYEIGKEEDYIQLGDVKKLLKQNNIKEKDAVTIKMIILNTFEGCEFFEQRKIHYSTKRSVFWLLKSK